MLHHDLLHLLWKRVKIKENLMLRSKNLINGLKTNQKPLFLKIFCKQPYNIGYSIRVKWAHFFTTYKSTSVCDHFLCIRAFTLGVFVQLPIFYPLGDAALVVRVRHCEIFGLLSLVSIFIITLQIFLTSVFQSSR